MTRRETVGGPGPFDWPRILSNGGVPISALWMMHMLHAK
jgi:hypothetical protein